jgi:limonene-1,2-epoxide hydrolase
MPDIIEMIGKEVEVIANGMSYKGVLIEVSDTEVHLKGMLGYVSLPTSGVTEVRPADKKVVQWENTFDVPAEEKKDLIP